MSMDSEHREDGHRALVAEYVLGVLPAGQHDRVEAAIEANAGLRAERDFWINQFSRFNDDYAESTPPAHLYGRIEKRLFASSAAAHGSLWDNLLFWRGLAAGALAIAVVAIGLNVGRMGTDIAQPGEQMVAMLEQQEGSDVRFAAFYDGQGNVRLTGLSGASLPDRDYELWAIHGDDAPISMGVIPVEGQSSVVVPANVMADWSEGVVLAVTLEPLGGAPEGIPTGPVVAAGSVTRI